MPSKRRPYSGSQVHELFFAWAFDREPGVVAVSDDQDKVATVEGYAEEFLGGDCGFTPHEGAFDKAPNSEELAETFIERCQES